MLEFNKLNNNLNDIFSFFTIILNNINNNNNNFIYIHDVITYLLLFCMNNIYLLQKLHKNIQYIIKQYIYNKQKYLNKLKNIEISLNNINIDIIKSYNEISIKKQEELNISLKQNIIYIHDKIDNNLYNSEKNNNLNLYSLNDIEQLLISNSNYLKFYKKDDNFIDYKYINLGYSNYYKINCYKYLKDTLPFNLLMYIQELDQIVIKLGEENNFKYINSKLYKVYNSKNEKTINNKSILCNNNIKDLNKKCYVENCKYYHDYIIGYKDNYHKDRQFSSNPIVYNCIDFKDGSKVKENIKNIEWFDAINIYQASLSTILIGCIHSLKK